MRVIADLHIHSKYSRATSISMDVENLARHAKMKGISLLGTGDFTHPTWLKELRNKLKLLDNGLFDYDGTHFMLTSEVNTVFPSGGRVKQIHNILFVPSFEIADQVNEMLGKKGDLSADGRPSLEMPASDMVEGIMEISEKCAVVPAHAWTPWRSIFGSSSGFNSMEECFGDQSRHIFALETGLSSDPKMNWMLSSLDKYALISNSDSHSPAKIGREANVFDLENPSYLSILDAIRKKDREKFKFTIEFFPEEGKYHYDGHRMHNICFSPEESMRNNNLCPVCKRKLTIGVLHRVMELADRPAGSVPDGAIPYVHLIPLEEVVANALGRGVGSTAVREEYGKLVAHFKNEFSVLLDASYEELATVSNERIAEGLVKMRAGNVKVKPGYDGVYGEIELFGKGSEVSKGQKKLGEFF